MYFDEVVAVVGVGVGIVVPNELRLETEENSQVEFRLV